MQIGEVPSAIEEHRFVLRALGDRMREGYSLYLRDASMITKSHVFRAHKSVCDWERWKTSLDDLLKDMDVRLLTQR